MALLFRKKEVFHMVEIILILVLVLFIIVAIKY